MAEPMSVAEPGAAAHHTLVSVVIPNYNYGHTLGLCLQAVSAQTYAPIEVIVADDGSTDDSVSIARAAGARVVRTPTNLGAPGARNLGAAHARGQILVFVDSDVAIRPDAVANAVALLESDAGLGAVCGNYDPQPLLRDGLIEDYRSLQQSFWLVQDEGFISTSYTAILAIRAEVFAEVGRFNPQMKEVENADFGHRLSQRYRILLTSAVRGRHDYDASLRVLLTKVFVRALLHVPLYVRRPAFSGGLSSGPRAWGGLAALLAVLTLPLPVLLGPVAAAVPAVLLAAYLACDLPLYRFVVRHRGALFLPFFAGMHLLVVLTAGTAALVGAAQWLLSGTFRRRYDLPAAQTGRAGVPG